MRCYYIHSLNICNSKSKTTKEAFNNRVILKFLYTMKNIHWAISISRALLQNYKNKTIKSKSNLEMREDKKLKDWFLIEHSGFELSSFCKTFIIRSQFIRSKWRVWKRIAMMIHLMYSIKNGFLYIFQIIFSQSSNWYIVFKMNFRIEPGLEFIENSSQIPWVDYIALKTIN